MFSQSSSWRALGAAVFCSAAALAPAQDSGPLIDTLVRKGILTDQEAEDLRADLVRDFGTTSPGKLDIAPAVTRLRISGDARVRYQYDNEIPNVSGATATAASATAHDRDRNRYRYRVRLGFTADIGPKWSVGMRMETANGASSTNADLGSGTDNFDKNGDVVYFGQAYIHFKDTGVLGSDAVDVRAGKLPHKFFTPGVNGFWIDTDINFEGLAEEIVYSDVGLKGSTLALRAGQFVLNNNAGNASNTAVNATSTSGTTITRTVGNTAIEPSLLLMAQAEYATKNLKVAPSLIAFVAPGDHDRAYTYSHPTSATTEAIATAANAAYAAAQANDTNVYTDLVTVLVPVEYTFRVHDKPLAVYATYGYNLEGEERAYRLAQANTTATQKLVEVDAAMYNTGVRYGENKLAGDYQLTAEYRYVGNGSYSSLLLDSDFNGGLLNGQGIILSGAYSFTDAITFTVTYFSSLDVEAARTTGSSATGSTANRGNGFDQAQVLQIDVSAKF